MTLAKSKPKRPSLDHRKRHGNHHRHSRDYVKTYWPYLPIITILVGGLVIGDWLSGVNKNVLGYATDMSVASLLDDTNQQRTNNDLASLNLNDKLDQAAQAKADDMAARDYWSHDTPDGQTPWTFITAAGYNYQTAGENLAYGFTTADGTITGWMNSPEHRANILNSSYHDVGFGIANIANYQNNGPETLIVAMYGSLPGASQASRPLSETVAPVIATLRPAASAPASTTTEKQNTVEPSTQHITQLELVSSNTPFSTLALALLGFSACAFIVVRHSLAWRKMLVKGERFVLHHTLLDVIAITIVSAVLAVSHTAGLIR
jgi:hypothetical protein